MAPTSRQAPTTGPQPSPPSADEGSPGGSGAKPGTLQGFRLTPDIEELDNFELDEIPKLVARAKRRNAFVWLHLVEPEEAEDHRRIYKIRKDIGRVDRAVSSIAAALRESTDHLESLTVGNEHIVPYLHDLLDDAAGTAALINNQSKALDAILSSHENNVAARQNKDMRTISAFAALLALPTLIAGVYGMNFKNIPLVQWQYGWVAIGVAMVIVDIVIYVMFKRRNWL